MATDTPTETQDKQEQAQGQLLTKPESIFGLLSRLKEHHIPLKLHFTAVEGNYSTIILKADLKGRFFIIDQVTPEWGDRLIAKSSTFTFEAFYDGCRIASTKLKAIGKGQQDGQAIYKIPFPDELDYFQRRQFYRAQIRRGVDVTTTLNSSELTEEISGSLKDISAQGCQIQLEGDYREQLDDQIVIDECEITFPNKLSICSQIQIRHVGYDEKKDISSCGCLFIDIPPMEERKISYAVAEVQREIARRSSDGSSRYTSPLYEEATENEEAPEEDSEQESKDKAEDHMDAEMKSSIQELKQQKEKARLQELFKEFRMIHTNAIAAVKGLMAQLKQKQPLRLAPTREIAEKLAEALNKNNHVLLALTTLRDAQDFVPQHCVSFGIHLANFAQSIGYKGNIADLIYSGMLHDIGKAALPATIVYKPERLTNSEFKSLQRHVIHTHQALTTADDDLPKETLTVVLGNTERLDGSGYPRQQKADKLSGLARMAGIVDAYDAMTTDRNYAKGMLPALAFKTLMNNDKQFDRTLVQRFIKCIGLLPVGSLVRLSTNKLAFVLTLNPQTAKPALVRVIYDAEKKQLISPDDYDLSNPEAEKKVGSIVRPEDPGKYHINRLLMMD